MQDLLDTAPGIEVRRDPSRQGQGVFTRVEFPAGARLGYFTGHATSERTRMSLQFGMSLFIEPGPEAPFRNLNHACSPSAHFIGRDLHASRDLHAGDAVTIDYSLHEEELAAPFPCKCGAEGCLGVVQGWKFLSDAQKQPRLARAGGWLFSRC